MCEQYFKNRQRWFWYLIRLQRYNRWSFVDVQILRKTWIFDQRKNIISNSKSELQLQNKLSKFRPNRTVKKKNTIVCKRYFKKFIRIMCCQMFWLKQKTIYDVYWYTNVENKLSYKKQPVLQKNLNFIIKTRFLNFRYKTQFSNLNQ